MLTAVWGDLDHNARLVFLGGLSSVARFMEYESWHRDREIDASIVEQFRSAVKGPGAELHREFIRVRDLLADGLDNEAWRQRQRFVGKLIPFHIAEAVKCAGRLRVECSIQSQAVSDRTRPGSDSSSPRYASTASIFSSMLPYVLPSTTCGPLGRPAQRDSTQDCMAAG